MFEDSVVYVKAAALLGSAFAIGVGTIGATLAQGRIAATACDNIGKHPASAGAIRNALILGVSMVETAVIFTVGIAGFLAYIGWSL